MSNWLTRLVEKEKCVLTAAGLGFPEGSFLVAQNSDSYSNYVARIVGEV